MAIQPIDLQTLYTQLDKIGKTQLQQQQAAQAAQDADRSANKTDAEKRLKTVQESDAGEERAGAVHERNGSGKDGSDSGKPGAGARGSKDDQADQASGEKEIIHDPALGAHIDISG